MMEKIEQEISFTPTYEHFKKIGIHPHHGICFPLFSIRSKDSCGIGEYTDLILFINFCKKTNMDVIQLLPLNESSLKDPSPYNAISAYALDFIYLGLHALPHIEKDPLLEAKIKKLKKHNKTSRVKHRKVRKKKVKWLRAYFKKYFYKFENSDSYKNFVLQNSWLKPYSVFRILKERFNDKKWNKWPKSYQTPTEALIESYYDAHKIEANFYIFLQFLCFAQLAEVKEYADENKILLQGDVPILTNPDSFDVWFYRSIFDMEKVAGAPPDDFNVMGQKWGFPILDWEALKNKNYFWWKQKLSVLQNIYHIYRIDHAVSFFRIWAINKEDTANHGEFLPKDSSIWQKQGEEHFLILLNASPLLPIAEDLGLIPSMVYTSLKKLGICGTKVPRWQLATPLSEYEPLSLTTLSTHDTETLTQFWKSSPKDAQMLCDTNKWSYNSELSFDLRRKILHDVHHSSSLFHINLIQEYLALFPKLIWKNPKKERINVPGKVNKKNWAYRIKPSLEELLAHEELQKILKEIRGIA